MFDLLSRLTYQKYLNYFNDEVFTKENRLKKSNIRRIGTEFALAGFLSPLIFISIWFNITQLLLLFYFCMNSLGYIFSSFTLIKKSINR